MDQLNTKMIKQKNNFEDSISYTKKENEMLRNKMVETDRITEG